MAHIHVKIMSPFSAQHAYVNKVGKAINCALHETGHQNLLVLIHDMIKIYMSK